ncbi:MAG: hypothetical protein N3A38_00010 [Planctomycetota bacterium]|nr:hypothetical protein [Planctomycetota bacterium]
MVEKILNHRLWAVVAACSFLLAGIAWWQASSNSVSAMSSGGTSGDGLICAVGTQLGGTEHVYVFDTNNPRLLVYESRDRADKSNQVLLLTCARNVQKDIEAVRKHLDLPFYERGYLVTDIEKLVKQ